MRKIVIGLMLLSSMAFGQNVLTSVQDGNFFQVGTWDCICIPTDGDTVIINHNITMNTGIPYTMGQIKINSGGVLSDGGVDKDIYINGGSFINNGTLECDGFWLDSGFVDNAGIMTLDSLLTQDAMSNSGTITVYDFLHDQDTTFHNSGIIEVSNNFNNEGIFYNYSNISIANNASNCNIQTSDALFYNSGILCVDGDFTNCSGDTLAGIGEVYISGSSSNLGRVDGTLEVNTPTSGFTLNTGSIGGMVTFASGTCILGAEEEEISVINIFPNPATDVLTVSSFYVNYQIYDMTGRMILNGSSISGNIDVRDLRSGTYLINIETENKEVHRQTFIKQ